MKRYQWSIAILALGAMLARQGAILLVLDNFEQVVGGAPETLGRWMAVAPTARYLTTSRVRLGIPGTPTW